LKKRPLAGVISPQDDFIASGGEDNIVTLWDIKTSNEIATLGGIQEIIKALDISPDGKYLAQEGVTG